MPALGRRRFLAHGSLVAAGLSLPFGALWSARARARGYGELVPDPAGILDLPAGFSYRTIQRTGQPMDDGYVVPGRPDGMACFGGAAGTVVLMRNHEVSVVEEGLGAYDRPQQAPPQAYDPHGFGGVTRLVLDADDFSRISSNLVLAGTVRNCSGGPSPWGWLTCEEDVRPGHGYVFLCSADASSVAMPHRIDGYGRFNHEAAAVDPDTLYCYLTEDREDGCLYRFVPDDPGDPFTGTLQAMRVVGQGNLELSVGLVEGDMLDVEWVDVPDPTPIEDTVRYKAEGLGAATISRGEGIWYFDGEVYLCSTNGGPMGLGQIFRLVDDPAGATLELVAQSEDPDVLDFPDNIAVAPWGQLFLAENGGGDQFIRAITDTGEIIAFARNAASVSPFAGICFSPDGRALFVNIQEDGLTLVVTGFPEPAGGDDTGAGTGADTGMDATGGSGGEASFTGSSGAGSSGAGSSGAGSSGDGITGAGLPGTSEGNDPPIESDDGGGGGCGCSSDGSDASGSALVGLVVLGLRS